MSRTQSSVVTPGGIAASLARSAARAALCWLAALGLIVPPARAAALSVSVLQSDGRPLPGAVITVHSLAGGAQPAVPVHAVMDQVDRMFRPDLLVIPVGSTVEFPNSDTTRHEVYSFSPAHPFELPLYRGKPYPPQRFDKAGLVTLGCNIHDFMLAYIVVTDASFYGTTDASGHWFATGVPRGRYRIDVWHPRLAEDQASLAQTLSVGQKDRSAIAIRLDKPLRPAMLDSHMSSWEAY